MLRSVQVREVPGWLTQRLSDVIYGADSAFSLCHPQPPGIGLRFASSWFQVDYKNNSHN